MTAKATRHAILDAAETLLGEIGFAAMTLRMLTRHANVNLAGVHYHFGSKEDLARAALSRRIAPINAERHARLDAVEQAAGATTPIPVEAIVAAFVTPVFGLAAADCRHPCTMMGRLIAEQPPFLRTYLAEQFREVAHRFAQALVHSVPGLSLADAFWRLHFMVGAMSHTMQHAGVMPTLTEGACGDLDVATLVHRLSAFCTAGAGAPPPAGRSHGRTATTTATR